MKNRIKKMMMESETSTAELARKLNWNTGLVETLLAENDPLMGLTGEEIEKIARYFHTNPAYLVGWSDDSGPMKEQKYTIQVLDGYDGFLNKSLDGSDSYFFDNNYDGGGCQTHFTQAEIDELKQRDDIAIDWDKAKIEPVEDN